MKKLVFVLVVLVALAPMVVAFNPQPEPPGKQRGKEKVVSDKSVHKSEPLARMQKASQIRVVGSKLRESKQNMKRVQARKPGTKDVTKAGGDKTAQKGIIVHKTAQPTPGMQMKKGYKSLQEGPFS